MTMFVVVVWADAGDDTIFDPPVIRAEEAVDHEISMASTLFTLR